ncbi:archaeal flagellin-like protein [Candidatus Nitrososphaera evergladensis SR1]|jgi:flagellin FlaB|uniref:Flagellin n=1 Tax=Candidatus Nitrososphaera evergladensis SR1 TaxID=1459636 RepID=A0A075MUQ6_9ARCH|nr:archaellin/type IV pilin N-terminal domain-containing protein [Candidatus Nitrososphaera evergladensis]AIF84407.1 archaeal flagellin-like protein [Candidatus Nitrososphaera evergladensis SR1]
MEVRRTPNNNRNRHNRRGVVGIESAIVLIAFVIVAAALSFVVLNMGFSTTQKAKSTITSGLGEASSAIEIAGQVTGKGNTTASKVDAYTIPIKLASGGSSVDITASKTAVKYFSKSVTYDNIFKGTLTSGTYTDINSALTAAKTAGYINEIPGVGAGSNSTAAFIYFTANVNNNSIVDAGEQAVLAIAYKNGDRPAALDTVNTEIIVSAGAPLTVVRSVPTITDAVLNLG